MPKYVALFSYTGDADGNLNFLRAHIGVFCSLTFACPDQRHQQRRGIAGGGCVPLLHTR